MNTRPTLIFPGGETFDFGGIEVVWKFGGEPSEGRFSVIHHPIAPKALAAPLQK